MPTMEQVGKHVAAGYVRDKVVDATIERFAIAFERADSNERRFLIEDLLRDAVVSGVTACVHYRS